DLLIRANPFKDRLPAPVGVGHPPFDQVTKDGRRREEAQGRDHFQRQHNRPPSNCCFQIVVLMIRRIHTTANACKQPTTTRITLPARESKRIGRISGSNMHTTTPNNGVINRMIFPWALTSEVSVYIFSFNLQSSRFASEMRSRMWRTSPPLEQLMIRAVETIK